MRFLVAAILFSIKAISGEVLTEGIVKKDLHLEPATLVNEYVKRDANGEFLKTNEWWNTAVACPACMGGPDTFTVISSYEIKKIDNWKYTVLYKIEGVVSGETFTTQKKTKSYTFDIVKTAWGHKLNNKAYQMVRVDAALNKFKSQLNKGSIEILKSIVDKKGSL